MSICLDVVCMDHQIDTPERQENTVRVIGEILPFVLLKYGIDQIAAAELKELDYGFVSSV
jgi:hypothetical protein